MQYRALGNTGIQVSALGFGALRLPMRGDQVDDDLALPVIRRALELGVNYIDTARTYLGGFSEAAVGRGIKGWPRNRVYLATKTTTGSDEDVAQWRERLETQIRRFDAEYIDFYNCHSLRWDEFANFVAPPGKVLDQARRAQAEGLIRHLSFSCHDTPENMCKLIDTGEFATITLQYNLLDRRNEPAIAHARDRRVGVVVMGPVGGGRLGVPSEIIKAFLPSGVKSTPEVALRFVLGNPGVSVALSGMSTIQMVEENAGTACRPEALSTAELRQIEEALAETQRLSDLYCTGCGYCQPCDNGVRIPENFRLMNYFRVYGLAAFARHEYARLVQQGASAEDCLECGKCEPKCPQHIRIVDQLRETAAALRA